MLRKLSSTLDMIVQNRNYQREVAETLVVSTGFECAIAYARNNHWHGVLEEIHKLPRAVNRLPES